MRDIKFRVWISEDDCMYLPDDFHLAAKDHPEDVSMIPVFGDEIVKDAILMQFTGLKDKNGKDIYEGDVVNYGYFALNDHHKFGKSAYKNQPDGQDPNEITTVSLTLEVKYDFLLLSDLVRMIKSNPDVLGVEVIGNIYENPELLEAKQ